METDLSAATHDSDSYAKYILGSAEAVGLMCLRVFTGSDQEYLLLKHPAMKLGAAFQKVNFLRDMQADNEILGRTYFPGVDFQSFSNTEKEAIQQDIERDFAEALAGIKKLPTEARGGVYLAYYYYRALFGLIKRTPPKEIMSRRIRISAQRKLVLMFESMVRIQLNML